MSCPLRKNWDGGCGWGEESTGTLTFGDVTYHVCTPDEALTCAGDPPSCTQTGTCEPAVVCE